MKALKHEKARYYLHIGHEFLDGAEQDLLNRHLSQCGTCQSYATELDALHTTLSRVMHAHWDTLAPASPKEDRIQSRIRRKIVQQRVLNLTSSLASGAVVVGLMIVIAWFFQFPKLLPVPPGSAVVPTRVNQTFGSNITLLSFELTKDYFTAGEAVPVTLHWQVRVTTQTSYAVFIHVQDEKGGMVVQHDAIPANGTRPTTGWKPAEVIDDREELTLPGTLLPGRYELLVGLYDPITGARLNTTEGKDALVLATLNVR
jgi:hypothetical protein